MDNNWDLFCKTNGEFGFCDICSYSGICQSKYNILKGDKNEANNVFVDKKE